MIVLDSVFAGVLALGLVGIAAVGHAQSTPPPPVRAQPAPADPANEGEAPTSGGTVLFSRDGDAAAEAAKPSPAKASESIEVTDAEREALTFTAYDLDVHLTPAAAGIAVRAGLTVRNVGGVALGRLVLQITSSAHWEAFSRLASGVATPLRFVEQRVDTDADHTGAATEAVVTLPEPLAPGASLTLTALYSGAIPRSANRLERIGAPAEQAGLADWDIVAAGGGDVSVGTALRGFGDVLWYPVAAAAVFLGDGAKLFDAVGRARRRQSAATVRLRLAIEYAGDPPDAVYFCGRMEPLKAVSDNADVPVAEAPGIATAEFAARPLGFRSPSLFVTDHPATAARGDADEVVPPIAAVTNRYGVLPSYVAAANLVQPLLSEWFGAGPLGSLHVLDHAGQPFEDDALLVAPMRVAEATVLAPSLVHSLTHAWEHSERPWIDEGLAQFASLLWLERTDGRAAAIGVLEDAARGLALAEPDDPDSTPGAGQTLIAPASETFYRTKAVSVWWMLREIAGDAALQEALRNYRDDAKLDADPAGFERTLEKFAHKDLQWFFDDWVYRDRGLPDLSIARVVPSALPAHGGRSDGWLVAVDVRNDGYAAAEVPVTVRSSLTSVTERLRVTGRSSASVRIVFPGTPEEILVNDGGVPEERASRHSQQMALSAR